MISLSWISMTRGWHYGDAGVVRDHNDGMPGFVQLVDDLSRLCCWRYRARHWFVGEDDFSAVHQGAGDGDALLLSASNT